MSSPQNENDVQQLLDDGTFYHALMADIDIIKQPAPDSTPDAPRMKLHFVFPEWFHTYIDEDSKVQIMAKMIKLLNQ